ncbi:MAG: FAD binding domain-containing protein [Oscillospiraceae bacterium]|nr:FAD binding domain-containing protein [Oscillospiraceae bacterium]
MIIHRPQTAAEAVQLRYASPDTTAYLAGGTDDLRLGGAAEGKELIDINALGFDTIEDKDGKIYIGARVTLQKLVESDLIPAFIKDAAKFCSSFVKRNSATVGGNLALRRDDSYLAAALCVADAKLLALSAKGEKEEPVYDYLKGACKCLLMYIVIEKDREGWVKRFGNTSASHATLIAAAGNGIYALSVKGSGLACGNTPDLYETMEFCDDLAGSAEYKKYLAKTVFSLRR